MVAMVHCRPEGKAMKVGNNIRRAITVLVVLTFPVSISIYILVRLLTELYLGIKEMVDQCIEELTEG